MSYLVQPFCRTQPAPGVMFLSEPRLGELDLTAPGFVVAGWEIGAPAERAVRRERSMTDGENDDTTYMGGRSVTVAITLNNRVPGRSTQSLYDALAPFTSPRYRPTLRWSLAGTPSDVRALTVVGSGLPLAIEGPKYQGVIANFRSPDAYMFSAELHCQTIVPSLSTELGRAYDLTFDRTYPASAPVGGFSIVNAGTAPADWTLTIFGATTNPEFQVNDTLITFEDNGGVDLVAGQTLVIDTAAMTVLLNGEPVDSRYDRANFLDWTWDDLRLPPGMSEVRFDASVLTTDSRATLCWRDRWL